MEKKNIKISRYTLRVPQELLDKLEYQTADNGLSNATAAAGDKRCSAHVLSSCIKRSPDLFLSV